MAQISHSGRVSTPLLAHLTAIAAIGMITVTPPLAVAANQGIARDHSPRRIKPTTKPRLDFSGRKRIGIASFYADWFTGRKMADGAAMNPHGDNAASRTLPLGTVATVTNLETHKTAIVTIQDRGPYVQGRIVDLSPSTARKIGITRRKGIAEVRVTPIAIPLRHEHITHGHINLANRYGPDHGCTPRCDRYRVALEQQRREIEPR